MPCVAAAMKLWLAPSLFAAAVALLGARAGAAVSSAPPPPRRGRAATYRALRPVPRIYIHKYKENKREWLFMSVLVEHTSTSCVRKKLIPPAPLAPQLTSSAGA